MRYSAGPFTRFVTAPNWPTPEPRGGRPPSCMTRRARSCSRSLSSRSPTTGAFGDEVVGAFADCALSTVAHTDDRCDDRGRRWRPQPERTGIRRRPVTDDGVLEPLERLRAQRQHRAASSSDDVARCTPRSGADATRAVRPRARRSPRRGGAKPTHGRGRSWRIQLGVPSLLAETPLGGHRLAQTSWYRLSTKKPMKMIRRSDDDEDRRLGDRRGVLVGGRPPQETRPEERLSLPLQPHGAAVADEEAEHEEEAAERLEAARDRADSATSRPAGRSRPRPGDTPPAVTTSKTVKRRPAASPVAFVSRAAVVVVLSRGGLAEPVPRNSSSVMRPLLERVVAGSDVPGWRRRAAAPASRRRSARDGSAGSAGGTSTRPAG